MSTLLTESFVEQLQEQLASCHAGNHQLLIADGDTDLIARLDDAFPETPMLDCPQSNWQLGSGGKLLEAIIHAANEGVTEIILSGVSSALSGSESESIYAVDDETQLYDRAKIAYAARMAAQNHFADQIESLLSNPEIAPRIANGSLEVKTLFYRAEADLFMVYHPESGQFTMLA